MAIAIGSILGGKFQLDRLVGTGGMGDVFRGRDLNSGQQVAVKVLRLPYKEQMVRFEREARVLAELDHPNIVRYLDHAVAPLGQPYIVMEWLDGEDLATRLRTGPLSVQETLAIGRDAAEALVAAHARGIVHRDLRPASVFLVRSASRVRGESRQSKLLGFGLTRLAAGQTLTPTSTTIGTGYLAPEQAGHRAEISPATDMFLLGCLLLECLTREPAFTEATPRAVINNLSFHTAPLPTHINTNVPVELKALIERMLAKTPAQRPRGTAVKAKLAELARLSVEQEGPLPMLSRAPMPSLTRHEQRLRSIVMIAGAPTHAGCPGEAAAALARLGRTAALHGGHLEVLADGAVVVTISGTHVATDQAALSARCALSLRVEASGRPVALAMGRSDEAARVPVGGAIDWAASTLARRFAPPPNGKRRGSSGPPPVAIDEITAGLLDGRFEVREGETGFELHGEREVTAGTRRVLGRPTACVGRDRELANLGGLFAACVDESMAHAALVTAPAGMGKSRLASELLTMIEARHEGTVFWIGRGDPLRGGSAFGLLRQALQNALGLRDGDPLAARQDTLRAHVARYVPKADQRRVTEFLGELLYTPFPDHDSAPLRAARQDVAVMSEQMQHAAEDFLRAECSAHPVLLVLEDLHWGDLPTMRFVDTALRDLKEQPWMVLALARPEVHEQFPQLWSGRAAQEFRLRPLTRSASERLVRQVLGEEVKLDTLARMVTQAEGNALYLEELIRAVAEQKGEALPETVVAMVHAQLGRLHDGERQLLRAASVFGEVFWPDGVVALLGGALPADEIHTLLEALVERELLVRRPDSRFTGLPELAFRHALLREGANAMLTETDQIVGHRLAAEWLEQQGESDPMVLAQHYERGHEPARAGRFYFQAAERALRARDTDTAIERARRALALGLPDAEQTVLLRLLAEVHVWRGEWEDATLRGEQALRLARPGTESWTRGMLATLAVVLREEKTEAFIELFGSLVTVEPLPEAVVSYAMAINFGSALMNRLGRFDLVSAGMQRVHAVVEPVAAHEPVARGWMHMSHVVIEAWAHEDPWAGLQHAEASRASFREANHRQNALLAQLMVAMNLWFLGVLEPAERELRGVQKGGTVFGLSAPIQLFCIAGVLADRGALEEAFDVASGTIAAWQARGIHMYEGSGRRILADVLCRRGAYAAAEREARAALELLQFLPLERIAAITTLAAALLAQGRTAEALAAAEDAMQQYQALGAFGFRGTYARLIHVEALEATGDHARACSALAAARDRLLIQAAKIGDLAVRRGFLENLPENARTLALARQWLGGGNRDPDNQSF
jgi:eukaryotic-like serine/threonine-protein kinase